jgi:transposase InsO family protein
VSMAPAASRSSFVSARASRSRASACVSLCATPRSRGLVRVKRGRTTIRVPGVRVADELLERRFPSSARNVLWVADLTYLRTWEGWRHLAALQDAYSRMIAGWWMAEHMRAELVVDALKMGVHRRRPDRGQSGRYL